MSDYRLDDEMTEIFETETPKQKKKPADTRYFEKLADAFLEQTDYGLRSWKGRDYIYTGTHWSEIDDLPNRVRMWMRKINVAQNNNIIGNVLPILRAIASVQVEKLPAWIGSECPFITASDAISFANGMLNVEKFLHGDCGLVQHTRDWFTTFCLPFDFDNEAKCERWLTFLNEVYQGDAERIALLQEWFGYCLTEDTSLHKLLMMVGQPRSGKGTIQSVLNSLVGSHNATGFSLASLADNFGLHSLMNNAVAFVGEVNLSGNRDRNMILEKLCNITGEDPVEIKEKFRPSISTVLPVKFFIATNQLPNFQDPSGALSKRLMVLDHKVSFADNPDIHLKKKLTEELAGIANWSLAGLVRLRKVGSFTVPSGMKSSITQFKRFS